MNTAAMNTALIAHNLLGSQLDAFVWEIQDNNGNPLGEILVGGPQIAKVRESRTPKANIKTIRAFIKTLKTACK